MKNRRIAKLLIFGFWASVLAVFIFPHVALAQANLFILPQGGTYQVGERFSVVVNVNTGGHAINAASAQINFDNTRLEVENLFYSRSIFTLWPQEPLFSNPAGSVSFSGGLPNPGFTGASGAILRILFKTKASGGAPVVFVSGSVLANDGLGTNVVSGLRGGLFNILPAAVVPREEKKPPVPAPVREPAPSSVGVVQKTVEAPLITDWPKQLEEGQILAIKGLGLPLSRVIVVVQKGEEGEPARGETIAGGDGRFSYTHTRNLGSGFYRVWARNVSSDGVASAPSESVLIEVVAPLFFRFGRLAINYGSIIVTLLALLLLLVALLGWVWFRVRKWQEKQGREISEVEKAVHQGFDRLRQALGAYLGSLLEARSPEELKKKEARLSRGLVKDIEEIEQKIEKEVEDIEMKGEKK